MIETILQKLNFDSMEAYIESEKKFTKEHEGKHVARKNPLLVLTIDEIDYFRQYINSHDYGIKV